jgi:hypothetical protein
MNMAKRFVYLTILSVSVVICGRSLFNIVTAHAEESTVSDADSAAVADSAQVDADANPSGTADATTPADESAQPAESTDADDSLTQEAAPSDDAQTPADSPSVSEEASPSDATTPADESAQPAESTDADDSLTQEAAPSDDAQTPAPIPVVEPKLIIEPLKALVAPEPAAPVPQKYLSLSLAGQPLPTERNLPWLPDGFGGSGAGNSGEIKVSVEDQGQSLLLSGDCSKIFFVVLVYRKADDYVDNPSSYVYNKASSCRGGGYSYELNDLSKDLDDGTYYLMVAEEGLRGPWQPITVIQPIGVSSSYK